MCRYCEIRETGVPGEKTNDNASIIKMRDGSEVLELTLWRYIYEDDNPATNKLIVDKSVELRDGEYTVKQVDINIKYCPFCGEKL